MAGIYMARTNMAGTDMAGADMIIGDHWDRWDHWDHCFFKVCCVSIEVTD